MIRIGRLAQETGISTKTLRYYDSIGLLKPDQRNPVTGYREYGEDALARACLIRSARHAGLRLKEIKEILASLNRSNRLPMAYSILDKRVETFDLHIQALKKLRTELNQFLRKERPGSRRK